MVPAGCRLGVGQPAMRTVPPLTTAAARNGTALDRSGSTSQCRAATVPGDTCQRFGVPSSTSTPACRSIATVIAMCGADGTDVPVCTIVSPSVNAGPDSIRPDTNCDDDDASISTRPPRTEPVPVTENGMASPSTPTPRVRSASSSGAMGRARACSSPSNSTTDRLSAATGGTNRSTVPASPQSTRAPSAGDSSPETVRSSASPSTVEAQRAHRADHQVGVPAAQGAADGRRALPLRRGQCGQDQGAVGQRFRSRHRDTRV